MLNKIKKIILILIIIIPSTSFGLDFNVLSNSKNYKKDSQFYVDVFVNTKGISVNGINGTLTASKNIKIVRIEDGSSIIKNWIDRKLTENKFVFSGIIPNGFSGYVNTANKNNQGLVFRIVLQAESNGNAILNLSNLFITKNDGEGTVVKLKDIGYDFLISSDGVSESYNIVDNEKPEISYKIVSDKDLFNGKKTLVFSATDGQSGISGVYIKESNGEFKLIESPYLLENQSFGSIILIKVVDNFGNINEFEIRSNITSYLSLYLSNWLNKIILAFVVLVVIVIIFYAKRKNKFK